jgi:hypothetical protein
MSFLGGLHCFNMELLLFLGRQWRGGVLGQPQAMVAASTTIATATAAIIVALAISTVLITSALGLVQAAARPGARVQDVVSDRAREKHGFLRYDCRAALEPRGLVGGDI